MNNTRNRKKTIVAALAAAAATVVAPAVLFAGSGTAHADNCEGILGAVFGSIKDCLGPYYNPEHPLQPTVPPNGPEANFPPMDRLLPHYTGGPGDLMPGWGKNPSSGQYEPQTTMGPFTGSAPEPGEFREGEAPEPRGWDYDRWKRTGDGFGPWPVEEPEPAGD
jgi:hypothetical protein